MQLMIVLLVTVLCMSLFSINGDAQCCERHRKDGFGTAFFITTRGPFSPSRDDINAMCATSMGYRKCLDGCENKTMIERLIHEITKYACGPLGKTEFAALHRWEFSNDACLQAYGRHRSAMRAVCRQKNPCFRSSLRICDYGCFKRMAACRTRERNNLQACRGRPVTPYYAHVDKVAARAAFCGCPNATVQDCNTLEDGPDDHRYATVFSWFSKVAFKMYKLFGDVET